MKSVKVSCEGMFDLHFRLRLGLIGNLGTLPLQVARCCYSAADIDSLAPARLALRAGLRPVHPEAARASGVPIRACLRLDGSAM